MPMTHVKKIPTHMKYERLLRARDKPIVFIRILNVSASGFPAANSRESVNLGLSLSACYSMSLIQSVLVIHLL